MAFLDPQEKMWREKSGRYFKLSEVRHMVDTVSPFNKVCDLTADAYCHGTIFRFPLRRVASGLSSQCYDMAKIHQLLQALREEGKLLLLFLRSIDTIEVHEIKSDGTVSLQFSVSISQDRERVKQVRQIFLQQIEQAYRISKYNIRQCIAMSVDMHIEVRKEGSVTKHHWLVVSHVGSDNVQVLQQAASQHVFPWVGVALELSNQVQIGSGRVFCFLPMPPDVSSPFPIHINGTFGLNDDRRTLRWQGVERTNDPAAQWNSLIVSQLLPPCYKRLIMDCITVHRLPHSEIYKCWPVWASVNASNWKNFLLPFLNLLLRERVVWTENDRPQNSGEWITLSEATIVQNDEHLPQLVHTVLTNCGLRIVRAPENIHTAIQASGFDAHYLTYPIARAELRRFPAGYRALERTKKLELLEYCMQDGQYGDLEGLELVPLADNTFVHFFGTVNRRRLVQVQAIYVCSAKFPQQLFRHMDNLLVSLDDQNMMISLHKVGASGQTQLQSLDLSAAVQLIKKSFPFEWQTKAVAEATSADHQQWYKLFWEWVQPYSLSSFSNELVVPLSKAGLSGGLQVTRLSSKSPVLYLTDYENCSAELMSSLSKMPVYICQTSTHPFFRHKEMNKYVNRLTPEGLLNALVNGCNGNYNQLNNITLTESEAQHVAQFLGRLDSQLVDPQISVLINLPIFKTVNKCGLYSIVKAKQCSWNNATVVLPDNCDISDENIPQNIVFLSASIHQRPLINKFSSHVSTPTIAQFVLNTVFVMVTQNVFAPATKLDDIMVEILTALPTWRNKWPKEISRITSALQSLPFLPTGSVRQSPSQLYEPNKPELVALFEGEHVFPVAPFNSDEMLTQLRLCGLMSSATLQTLVGVVNLIRASLNSSTPQLFPQMYAPLISTTPQLFPQMYAPQNSSASQLFSQMRAPLISSTPQLVTQVRYNRAKAVLSYLKKLNPTEVSNFFQQVANISWLPVLSKPPSLPNSSTDSYPPCLPYKGKQYACHFVSLGSHVFVPTSATVEYSFILGSQVYIADCVLQDSIPDGVLPSISTYIPQVLAHFKEIITHAGECEPTEEVLRLIYYHLNKHCSQVVVDSLKTFPPWIWLTYKRTFVSPSVVAMKPNPSFSQDLSPYIYTLSDGFGSKYQSLFTQCGVAAEVVSRQIASVLEMMSKVGSGMMAADKAWQLVMGVLNWLTNSGEQPVKEFDGVKLYIPVESDQEYPVLKEAGDNVVYSDNEFLEGVLARSGQEYSYTLVNRRIGPRMARCLGLAALSEHLDISEETFEDVGQCEPLTVRLRNILRDYKDGLTIIKELIQNADDAEATEINICYDTRTHCTDQKALFFPHMAEAHGPALVVHNNAVFTDDDFQNITKLAGATKENKPLKIGKFGIGFCSVYHITDVPSFVSREFLYIFDPTLKYLGDAVKNRSRPGKKLSFTHRILRHSKQMDSFRNMFDFNPDQKYNGTIFRLPFRSSPTEISSTVYDDHMVMELLGNLKKYSNEVILFLHHIKCITFSRFDISSERPTVLAKIEKQDLLRFPKTKAMVCNLTTTIPSAAASSNAWLVATTEMEISSKFATSSVACPVKQSSGRYEVCSCDGESFCFLPLAKTTGLPVHVNSNFAVSNNRRGIWTDDGSQGNPPAEAQWNVHLMTSTIPEAYCLLLETLKEMQLKGQLANYDYCALWPLSERLQEKNPWSKALDCLYKLVASKELFYSSAVSKWLAIEQSKFLSNNILSVTLSQPKTEDCVLNVIAQLGLPVVDLPMQYHTYLDLSRSMITEANFIDLFFTHIGSLGNIIDTRNSVLLKMFELYTVEQGKKRQENIAFALNKYPCVPCTPDGTVLKRCCEIIDPESVFARMYESSENMLPTSSFCENTLAKASMNALGLYKDFVPWKYIIQRATGVNNCFKVDKKKALQRVDCIIESIRKNISSNPEGLSEEARSLATIPFLPVKGKPKEYPLPWCGEGTNLACGKELVLSGSEVKHETLHRNELLSGSQVKILKLKFKRESSTLLDKVIDLLQIKCEPLCADVVSHFTLLTQLGEKELLQSQIVQTMCRSIYGYFEIIIKDDHVSAEMETLKHSNCILVKEGFVNSEFVSEDWSLDGPYLFRIPAILTTRRSFAAFAGVKPAFSSDTVFKALLKMKADFGDNPISQECQYVIGHMIPILTKTVSNKPACSVMLPDTSYRLHDACDLVYNDTPWCPFDREETIFIHENIPRHLAQKLGVKTVRSQRVERYASDSQEHFLGSEFGQHEDLTQRIQNIIREYPFDETIIKELLQNADDAKASKVYVILDKRTHKTDKILSENWKELQGPALLVWNDSIFSEKDLTGIQRLGLGSKRSDAETIGQYGIGFNAVYHLTDCPSFISNGETLCILDPHCRYAPGAGPLKPGRRFDRLSTGFWDDFNDMRSAYLCSETQHFPEAMQADLKGGSLFRFPIRHSEELVALSKIVPKHDVKERSSRPLRVHQLQKLLDDWSPLVKMSMFFLNNVNTITFCTVEQNGQCTVLHHIETHVNENGRQKCTELQEKVHLFKPNNTGTPYVVNYELEVLEKVGNKAKPKERWLIQQGIGDVMNVDQEWSYIHQVKPRHGIAFPLTPETKFESFVFCFLPLPIQSHLPVLINGHFILDSNRRELWKSTNPDHPDQKSTWNWNLISAIASSYVSLLTDGGRKVVVQCEGRTREQVEADVQVYYSIFPDLNSDQLKGCWKDLAAEVYKKLAFNNAAILAIVREVTPSLILPTDDGNEPPPSIVVKWCKLKNVAKQSEQVHFFCTDTETDALQRVTNGNRCTQPQWKVFEAIGMLLTSAPTRIMEHFKHEMDIPMTTPAVVFDYYSSFNAQVLLEGHSSFPCCIEDTAFSTIDSLKTLLKYLIVKKDGVVQYVKSPFGVPLLLTADGNIRVYAEHDKVILSEFSSLFPHSLHRFLHPDLISLHLGKNYFIDEAACAYDNIHDILSATLPDVLLQCCVGDFEKIIGVADLKAYWKCFCTDLVFLRCLPDIIQRWALLLSTTDQLFSGKSELLPIIDNSNNHQNVVTVLKSIGVPLLQPWVCAEYLRVQGLKCCPTISNPSEIVICLQIFHKEKNISFSSNDTPHLDILIEYFSKINFKTEKQSKEALKSLPLFQTIDGDLVGIKNQAAYLFPTNTCLSGHEKWFVRSDATFLDRKGLWYKYLSPSDIDIKEIRPEEIYCQYIFPRFHLLSENERYEQLKYIRDATFKECNFQVTCTLNLNPALSAAANTFLRDLKTLRCLGVGTAPLQSICEHCDHTMEIFTLFKESFCFLPEKYRDENGRYDWLQFFRNNGLQTSINKIQFLKFCREVESGHNSDTTKASNCLLEYLFQRTEDNVEWCKPVFLHEVASIPFVRMKAVSNLSWIRPICSPAHQITTSGETFPMTKLNGAFLDSYSGSYLVWTVRPLVSLPQYRYDISHALGVRTTVQIDDIIQNISCIAEGHLSNASHFDRLSENCKSPRNAKSLIEVMSVVYKHIQTKHFPADKDRLCSLQSVHCIPVYRVFGEGHEHKDVSILVKPCQVVTSENAKSYYPFVHQLPNTLFPYLDVLECIGVKKEVEVSHLRIVLEMAFHASKNVPLDVNTNKTVMAAITCLHEILKKHKTAEHSSMKPLYLPDNTKKLSESTALVYRDDLQYKDAVLDFSGTELSEVCIPSSEYSKWDNTRDFCSLLPEAVKPKRLSSCITMQIHSQPVEVQSPLAVQLQNVLKMHKIFRAISAIVKNFTGDEALAKKCYESLVSMASRVEVISVQGLRYGIMVTSSQKVVGSLTVKHAFDAKNYKLYIEPTVRSERVMSSLSRWLMDHIESTLNSAIYHEHIINLSMFLPTLLNALNEESVDEALNEAYSLELNDDEAEPTSLDPQLGQAVPVSWHHRLDLDIHNIFIYQEWVGYEKEEGRIVFAQIIHRVVEDGNDPYKTKYVIRTSEGDMNGIEVSALDLYKFLRGDKIPDIELSDSQELVLREASENTANDAAASFASAENVADLQEMLRQLCQELREIWRLPEEERRRAVKRLYLKWHPDKNLHRLQLADEVFKFLKRQVDRLADGLSLEDPTSEATSESSVPGAQQRRSNFWQSYYSHWDETAHHHHRSWHNERRHCRNRRRGRNSGGGGGGGGGAYNFWSQPSWQPTPNRAEGHRWLQQAEADLEVLKILHNTATTTTPSTCSYAVCFMAYEVVSKALKAGLYFKCGLSSQDRMQHNVAQLASTLEAEVQPLRGMLVVHALMVKDYEEATRFPHLCPDETVPARHFGPAQATVAMEHASAVLAAVKGVMEV